jgi:hypothetical protein
MLQAHNVKPVYTGHLLLKQLTQHQQPRQTFFQCTSTHLLLCAVKNASVLSPGCTVT